LGVSSESDIVDQYINGIITKDQALSMAKPAEASKPPVEQAPREKIRQIAQKAQKGEANQVDFAEALEAIDKMAQGYDEQGQQSLIEENVKQCKSAVDLVIGQDTVHADLPENIKEIESQVFLSSTDNLLTKGANDLVVHGIKVDRTYFTPQRYGYFAKKNIDRLNTWRNYYIDLGAKRATTNIQGGKPQVNPMSPSSGGAPITPAKPKITLDNMSEAARRYIEKQETV